MSRDAVINNILFSEEVSKSEQSRIFRLLRIDLLSGDSLFLVDSNYDVSFNSQVYTRFPFVFSSISMNTDGSIDKASLTVANVSRELMFYIENFNGLRGCRVTVRSVFERFLDYKYICNSDGTVSTDDNLEGPLSEASAADAYVEDEFIIDSYSADERVLQFQLDPVIDFQIKVPRRRLTCDSCYWVFKDAHTCGYVNGSVKGSCAGGTTVEYFLIGGSIVNSTYFSVGDLVSIEGVEGHRRVISLTDFDAATGVGHFVVDEVLPSFSLKYITFNDCRKDLASCLARNNTKRFGGFPGITSTRQISL